MSLTDRRETRALRRTSQRSRLSSSCPIPGMSARRNISPRSASRRLATTSAGAAFAAGLPDGGMTRAAVLSHIAELVAATDLPFNADYEAGFAATRDELHDSAVRCIATGVAGFSIEDYTGDAHSALLRRPGSGRSHPRRARGDQRQRRARAADGAQRDGAARPSRRAERGFASPRRLCGGGRRRALRARAAHRRRDRPGRARRRPVAGQCAGGLRRG